MQTGGQQSAETIAKIKQKSGLTAKGTYKSAKGNLLLASTPSKARMIKETVTALIQTQYNKTQASKILGITIQALLGRMKNNPAIEEWVNEYNRQSLELSKKHMESASFVAATTVTGLMNSDSERMRLDAATQVLDRVGIGGKTANNVQVNVLNQMRGDKDQFSI